MSDNDTSNILIGGGSLTPGDGTVTTNTNTWTSTGDAVTLKMLQQSPNLYARAVAEKFGLQYDARFVERQDWTEYSRGARLIDNPNAELPSKETVHENDPYDMLRTRIYQPRRDFFSPTTQAYRESHVIFTGGYASLNHPYTNQGKHLFPFTGAVYSIGYNHPEEGEKVSRPIRYWYGCKEIQTIIDNDLISGVSGYSVSPVGDIIRDSFGPFTIQANQVGGNDNPLYIKHQSHTGLISGSLSGFTGARDLPSQHVLRYTVTGTGIVKATYRGFNLLTPGIYHANINKYVYDLTDGRIKYPSVRILDNKAALRDPDTNRAPQLDGQFSYGTTANTFQLLHSYQLFGQYCQLQYLFDNNPAHFDHLTEFHITGAKEVFPLTSFPKWHTIDHISPDPCPKAIYTYWTGDDAVVGISNPSPLRQHFPDLDGYNEENYFWCGAPNAYIHPRRHTVNSVRIYNNPLLSGFRIPAYAYRKSKFDLQAIRIAKCPNFEKLFLAPDLDRLSEITISGTRLEHPNQYHICGAPTGEMDLQYIPLSNGTSIPKWRPYQYPISKYPDGPPEIFFSGIYSHPRRQLNIMRAQDCLRSTIPSYLRSYDPDDLKLDTDHHMLTRYDFMPFHGSHIRYINICHNFLDQTGIYSFIKTALYSKQPNGVFKCKNNRTRSGPRNPVFSNGFRGNLYLNAIKASNGGQVPEGTYVLPDVNDNCLSGFARLEERGWTVEFDQET